MALVPEPFQVWLEERVAEQKKRVATVHERVACPRCQAPLGKRCRRMPLGYGIGITPGYGREMKYPHDERLRSDGIYPR
jgi:hypothetical protein